MGPWASSSVTSLRVRVPAAVTVAMLSGLGHTDGEPHVASVTESKGPGRKRLIAVSMTSALQPLIDVAIAHLARRLGVDSLLAKLTSIPRWR